MGSVAVFAVTPFWMITTGALTACKSPGTISPISYVPTVPGVSLANTIMACSPAMVTTSGVTTLAGGSAADATPVATGWSVGPIPTSDNRIISFAVAGELAVMGERSEL